ncbi:MAG: GNAT family N-acetyltransferase [Clostridium sp.]|nr:GNAT family N-acetyltransferase [Clostridium sp.]
MDLEIRKGLKGDAGLIADAVAMAIGYDGAKEYVGDKFFVGLEEAAQREDTQYSYRNALVAVVGGKPVGAIVGYDGGKLKELRDASLSVIRKYQPGLVITEDETEDGEFYLDSLCVLPEYRGNGIGRRLIEAMIDKGMQEGHRRFGLLVDFENPKAEKLYVELGFKQVGCRPFIGHQMKHMQKTI